MVIRHDLNPRSRRPGLKSLISELSMSRLKDQKLHGMLADQEDTDSRVWKFRNTIITVQETGIDSYIFTHLLKQLT